MSAMPPEDNGISYSELLKEAVCMFASLTPMDWRDMTDRNEEPLPEEPWAPLLARTAALRALAALIERIELSEREAYAPATTWGTHARGIRALDRCRELAAGFRRPPRAADVRKGQ